MPRKDPFFDKQPPLSFTEELKTPLYTEKPENYGKREAKEGEIDVSGMYIGTACPDMLLETSWNSLNRFLMVYELLGERFPVNVSLKKTERHESFELEITEHGIEVLGDAEGIRRALVWLEDELRRAEAPYLFPTRIERHAVIRSRITRCFFSPINRPPKYGDELSDDIDYYPEEYLNRLMHDGANGVWIYTRFSDLIESSFVPGWGKGGAARLAKLNRVIDKCARYGIGVYVFAIEPYSLTGEALERFPQLGGRTFPDGGIQHHCVCVECKEGRDFIFESGKRLLEAAPGLRGFISITQGERNTSCASYRIGACPKGGCPVSDPKLLSDDVEALRSGFRSVNPECEVISWTYGHRTWDFEDIRKYVENAPLDVMLMQNFDDMGYEEQLGIMRQCVDYWLSYVGPSELFEITAEKAAACGKHMFAKMQVCCSHEIASVPYVPVPGILYKKYAGARRYGVEGILQCWYFGNYPSIMSKAAGELAFLESFSDEDAFLHELAAIFWGRSHASVAVEAWKCFEAAYRMYPMNVMFSYYGPMHDSVVWKLWLEPKNYKLPRTWQTLDPIDGDRFGECLLQGHTMEEAYELAVGMTEIWEKGVKLLSSVSAPTADMCEQISVAGAIGLLFSGGKNIIEFYLLREKLGYGEGEPMELLCRMEALVRAEIENSRAMIALCEADGRLGYHSEGEGYKFFPEKLMDRIEHLENLLATEFPRVRARISGGAAPLSYYLGEGEENKYFLCRSIDRAEWEKIGTASYFRASMTGTTLTLDLRSDRPTSYLLCPEYRLFTPNVAIGIDGGGRVSIANEATAKLYYSIFGGRISKELEKYADITAIKDGWRLRIDLSDFGLTKPVPFKMRILAGGKSWIESDDRFITLGLHQVIPEEYGWMIPEDN
jgi:hypothetical protein